ncbi:MAG TPA: NAD(P)/FAD-dependent oxidoreductase [Kineosporiaceae bacterium]|nr:NAD(P)/FAD-dependent oxidoreductase [Kineosporiaceae bacterium]
MDLDQMVPAAVRDLTSPLTEDLDVDAVVIGAGPNGLVATCLLAMAGWDVCLLERNGFVGGAVASVRHTPGYVSDLCSAFYPLTAASPVIAPLELELHGLRWRRSPAVLAHVPHRHSETSALLHHDPEATAAALDTDCPGDGEAWLQLFRDWRSVRDPLLEALFTPFPPIRAVLRLLIATGTPQALRLARRLVLPVDRLGAELFRGEHGRLLLAGNAMHADVPAIAPGSGAFGLILSMLAQDVGYPVPEGGAGALAAALACRARTAGARIHAPADVVRIVVGGGRALGALTRDGHRIRARRAVLADVAAPALYRELLHPEDLPTRLVAELDRCFVWDLPTVKCNWLLRGRLPWRAKGVTDAGTVHLGAGLPALSSWSAALGSGQRSPHTFEILGQLAAADPSRAPAGGESVWAYSHLPRGIFDPGQAAELARRMEEEIEEHAPGFGELVVDRFDQLPQDLAEHDVNLVHGTINGGTAQLFQQLVFRPIPGLGRPETPVRGLYLASAAASPGGGVHGACGAQAARAALAGARLGGLPGRFLVGVTRHLAG